MMQQAQQQNDVKENPLRVSFQTYLGSPKHYEQDSYTSYLTAEQVRITTTVDSDKQEVQWLVPLRNDGNYLEQAKRLLYFLQVTKFGMIALQGALNHLGIKTPSKPPMEGQKV